MDRATTGSQPELGAGDLVLCAGTLATTPLLDRVPLAVDAGYAGLSVFTTDLDASGRSAQALHDAKDGIEAAGLRIAEIDPLISWYPSAQRGDGFFAFSTDDVLEMAVGLGARSINAVAVGGEPSEPELVDAFAALCERGAEHGLLVHLEFMPFAAVPSLADAVRIVEAAGQTNGGIMLDVWHLKRSGGTIAEVESAAARITAVQLDDAPDQPEGTLFFETMHRRLLPGEGDADVVGILRALRRGGSQAPLGVEVFSDELASLGAKQVAERSCAAARRVRDASGS